MRAIVHPADRPLAGKITAQPSKNYTSRYLLAAALAEGTSIIRNVATSEDSEVMQRAITGLGARVRRVGTDETLDLEITGVAGKPRLADGSLINAGNAGAVLRLLIGTGALVPDVTFVTDRPDSLGKRPNEDLLDALVQLGCEVESDGGRLPIRLRTHRLRGGIIAVSGSKSSQYLSSLLFLAPLVGEPVEIRVTGVLVSKAPVRQTLEVIRRFGVAVDAAEDLMRFAVAPQLYRAQTAAVNGDWPGSAAVMTAAAVTGGSVTIDGIYDDEQGEKESATVLRNMGADVLTRRGHASESAVHVRGRDLTAVDFDGDLATDAVLALCGAACVAHGLSRFYNVANLRLKECDRISEPIAELRKLGVQCQEGKDAGDDDHDAILIEGNPYGYEGGITVDGRRDHRVIMLLTIVALRCRKAVTITGAEHIAKSYPDFFPHMRRLGARIEEAADA
jgi:3-phosphoshikimate 1-carboxyvinyltransferase